MMSIGLVFNTETDTIFQSLFKMISHNSQVEHFKKEMYFKNNGVVKEQAIV